MIKTCPVLVFTYESRDILYSLAIEKCEVHFSSSGDESLFFYVFATENGTSIGKCTTASRFLRVVVVKK